MKSWPYQDLHPQVAYVGATKNLCMRMKAHASTKTGDWVTCHWLPVRKGDCDGSSLLRAVEARMIEELDPPCNNRKPKPFGDLHYPPRSEKESMNFIPEETEERDYSKSIRLRDTVFKALRQRAVDLDKPMQVVASELLAAALRRPVERLR